MNDLAVGDRVTTDFSGKWSEHTVAQIDRSPPYPCQSGVVVKVTPFVLKSGGDVWIDVAWFKKVAGKESDG